MSSALARMFIRRRRSLIFREAWLMLCERPLHRTRSARISAALSRSRTDIRPPSLYLLWVVFLGDSPLDRSPLPSTVQATLDDDLVLAPLGVSRTLVPLDGIVVA